MARELLCARLLHCRGRGPPADRGRHGGDRHRGGRGRVDEVPHEAVPGHHKVHIDLTVDGARPSGPSPFVPRSVIKAKDTSEAAPKSNSDFRNMFLKK